MSDHEYFVGLDVGTESVGWAVTDTEYHILKSHGKALWGIRLFEEANGKDERRMHRASRRRIERTKQRIDWLEDAFSAEIGRVDPGFYQRLAESKFLEEDKLDAQGHPLQSRFSLFADRQYCDKDYHKEFPTIYHLRCALMQQDRKFDIRLIYLAVHHIMKNRGHFLFADMNLDDVTFASSQQDFNRYYEDEYGESFPYGDQNAFEACLADRNLGIKRKSAKLMEITGVSKKNKREAAILTLLCGGSVKLKDLLGEGVEFDAEEASSVCLKDLEDDKLASLHQALGDHIALIEGLKKIYDFALLKKIRAGKETISEAKIEAYEMHRRNLAQLKAIMKQIGRAEYKAVFCKKGEANYPAYTGHGRDGKSCTYEDFAKTVCKILDAHKEIEGAADVRAAMSETCWLPKQRSGDNSVIPHQLHGYELAKILDKASVWYPFLNEKDASGLTLTERICQMFSFRLPYYSGPLDNRSEHSWIVRSNEKIYPWNFDKVVDVPATAAAFINRMTAKCTYIGEDVLPKESLLYSRFMVLNELNNVSVNGQRLTVAVKQQVYHDLFETGRKITVAQLKKYLVQHGYMKASDEIAGVNEGFKSTLKAWRDFQPFMQEGLTEDDVEEMIRRSVLFGDDRKLFDVWLNENYSTRLSAASLKRIRMLKYAGWGNLSKAFLTEIEDIDPETGEILSIINAMWHTQNNLMELLSSRYQFNSKVEQRRKNKYAQEKLTLEKYLDANYAAPAIRRSIRQTLAIVSEIEKIEGCAPKRIFVEVARGDKEEPQNISRKQKLQDLYKACRKDEPHLAALLDEKSDGDLRRDKLYLYFQQKGKCMYSGEPIDLSRLDTDYDIDHIWPQSKIKDDSLENRVLVKRTLNFDKKDQYPLPAEWREKMRGFWGLLHQEKWIGDKKYQRLTRATGFNAEELAGFIARQLLETRQSTKLIAEMLEEKYQGKTEIVYVKAGNVSSFRQDQRIDAEGNQKQATECKNQHSAQDPVFIKCREVNDFHHAKDAYLNIVVGNVYHVKFTKNPANFINSQQTYSLNRMFDYPVVRGKETAWTPGSEGSIAVVRKTMAKNNILFTRYAHEAKGGFYDQQLKPMGEGQAQIKSSDARMTTEKFGGYNKLTGAYFFLVEHKDKKKTVRSLETVYLISKSLYEKDPIAYCEQVLELVEPKIIIPQIKIDSLISYDGFRMHVSGRSGMQIVYKNANQLVVAPEWQMYIKQLFKYVARCTNARNELAVTARDAISTQKNTELYNLLIEKMGTKLYAVRMATPQETLISNADAFETLSILFQCQTLQQILNIYACDASSADLKILCNKARIGLLLTSKNLDNYAGHQLALITQSVTGVFEQRIPLL